MIEFFPSRTIAISFGQFGVHWYGVMYALAFWVAYVLLPYLGTRKGLKISRDAYTMLIVYVALGVLIGGRLGYALFYEPVYFLFHPFQVVAIWLGGMSSHGGFIGVAIAVWLWGKKYAVPLLAIADIITIPAAIGLALGRVGNFINQELYSGYDALLDTFLMFCIAGICYVMLRRVSPLPFWEREGVRGVNRSKFPLIRIPHNGGMHLLPEQEKGATASGLVIATFLILYSISRFFLEYIRPQEWVYTLGLTRGQFLTIPVLLAGVLLFLYARSQQNTATGR